MQNLFFCPIVTSNDSPIGYRYAHDRFQDKHIFDRWFISYVFTEKTSKSRNLESSIFQIKMKIGEFIPNIWKKLVTFLFKSLSVKSPSINIWIKIKILILGQSQDFTICKISTLVNQKVGGLKCNYLIIWRFIGIKRSKVAIKWTILCTIVCTSISLSKSVTRDDRSDFL